jgi:hypothetical protein
MPDVSRPNKPTTKLATWLINCANCGASIAITEFDGVAFCGDQCRATARAIRYGRRQVARFGPSSAWSDEVLLSAVGRVPKGELLAEMDRRWNAPEPMKPCDQSGWNEMWLKWVQDNRRKERRGA